MHKIELTHLALAIVGMLIHVLMKIVDRKDKTIKCSCRLFFSDGMNYVRIALTILSTLALLYMANDIALMFGITLPDGSPAKSVIAFLAGYSNHSFIRNVLKLLKKK